MGMEKKRISANIKYFKIGLAGHHALWLQESQIVKKNAKEQQDSLE
jgi:hypothetical protein